MHGKARCIRPRVPDLLFASSILIAAAAGCGQSGRDRPTLEVTAIPRDGKQVATIALHSFYFEPNRVIVRAGVPVEMKLSKKSLVVPHSFSLYVPDEGIRIDESVGTLKFFPGGKTVRFTVRTPGEYVFSCGEGHHAEKGMMGTLVVLP